MTPLRVFIGYESRQPVAFQVAAHSVWSTAKSPVSVTRLDLSQLPMTRRGLTEFTYSRFLVPWLSNYDGISIFLDSDVLCRGDVAELLGFALAYPDASVCVVPHERTFERPSVMVFNNVRCRILTPQYVQDATHSLFDFSWAATQGTLPDYWNHLVGYDAPNPDAKLVHFTQGLPCWPETKACEFAEEWHEELQHSTSTVSFQALMGRSVHVLAGGGHAHMKKPVGA